ncbi:13685_t:CDS:2 [Entrophospora sp. SA101]|nr:13685_t:CDS:2 [Entrophospora sp. SA101]CAJ0838343.1 11310_t:CDS:2 [Entrophospora sp. SA101]CAJ0877042.1 2417_t:CDS:2 [Entrophospora sp. SA101]
MASSIFLLPEIILPIVSCLKNDPYSLHSCMLVSRSWCKLTVPFLWTDPFNPYSSNTQIISTYMNSLSSSHKSFLKKIYPMEKLEIDKPPPIFNYTNYLKVLNYSLLHDAVHAWCDLYRIRSVFKQEDDDDFEECKKESGEYFYDGGDSLLFNPKIKILELLFDLLLEKTTLTTLSIKVITHRYEFCTTLSKLTIDCSWGNDASSNKLLISQTCLIELIIINRWPNHLLDSGNNEEENNDTYNNDVYIYTDVYNENYYNNDSNNNDNDDSNYGFLKTIKCLEFKNSEDVDRDNDGSLDVLKYCENLKVLKFNNWKSFGHKYSLDLADIYFPKLEELLFSTYTPRLDILIKIIRINGQNLKCLTLVALTHSSIKSANKKFFIKYKLLIETISENCPNLITLNTSISSITMSGHCNLLQRCTWLANLSVEFIHNSQGPFFPTNESLLLLLGSSIPISLKQLTLKLTLIFEPKTLHNFLFEHCKARLEKLKLFMRANNEHFAVLQEYAKTFGSLKLLDLRNCDGIEQDQFHDSKKYIKEVIIFNSYGERVAW